MTQNSTKNYNMFIGQPLEILKEELKKDEKTLRITKMDGRYTVCSRDVNVNRLNVEIENNIVSAIVGFG